MPVVKANAYGHGLIPVAQHFERLGSPILGVNLLEEGVRLRQAGIKVPILVMGGIVAGQIEHFIDFDLEITVSSLEKLAHVEASAEAKSKKAVVHLKFDTGLNRIGVQPRSALALIEAALKAKHVQIKGIFSHLACADDPQHPMTYRQLAAFKDIINYFKTIGAPMPLRHLANSGGVLHFPETHLDLVRPGIALYGVMPSEFADSPLDLRTAMRLISEVVYFKVLKPGQTVSYGATWKAPKETRIVTIPVGYGDGFPRGLSNRGHVLIHGKRYPIVGTVCMDQFMVNIGWDSAYNGDEVILAGAQGDSCITIEEIAALTHSVPYEFLTNLNERIPRVYKG
jgi:alanine racemase